MKENCFVIMPYGIKKDIDGNEIDFDAIYEKLIKKAVERIARLECIRCDDIEKAGWIHQKMLGHILEDPVAIVDTSTLNANVFYELGIRHALKKAVTVLIHRQGTSWPFNIKGLNSIEYDINSKGIKAARNKIVKFITNGLNDSANIDSLVYHAVPDLQVKRGAAKPLTKVAILEYLLVQNPQKRIALITGDRENIKVGDIWVNSENTDMQMDRFYGKSTSATIRYLGARKHETTGKVVEDTIGNELANKMGREKQVEPAAVVVTGPGTLRTTNNVRWIFHLAAVFGQPREGYRPIDRLDRCVTNALKMTGNNNIIQNNLSSILFPILGTGPAGGDLRLHANMCIDAAVDWLTLNPDSSIQVVYFYVWSEDDLDICRQVVREQQGLEPCEIL